MLRNCSIIIAGDASIASSISFHIDCCVNQRAPTARILDKGATACYASPISQSALGNLPICSSKPASGVLLGGATANHGLIHLLFLKYWHTLATVA